MAKLCHLKIIKNNLISHVSACFYFYYFFLFLFFLSLLFFLFSLLSPDFFSLGLRISPPLVFSQKPQNSQVLSENPFPPKFLCLNLHRDRLPLVDLPYDTKMKNAKKKKRRARASNFNGKGVVATNGEDEESKALQALAEAFSLASLDDAVSAYNEANDDPDIAA